MVFKNMKFTKQVLIESGLVETGLNDDGVMEYLGTDKQWKEAERLQLIQDRYDLDIQESKERVYDNH